MIWAILPSTWTLFRTSGGYILLQTTLLKPVHLHVGVFSGMNTITIKSICDSTVSSTTPDSYDPHDLMGKVGESIETLDIILYQMILCKSKLDEIFRQLSQKSEDGQSVSISVGNKIMHIE